MAMTDAIDLIAPPGLHFGPLGANWVHLCVDMQRMFAEQTDWHAPWMQRVLPEVVRLVEMAPERTVFTRFIPARSADDVGGTWRRYYQRWAAMTGERLDPGLLELIPALALHTPPARVLDKPIYSPWLGSRLHAELQAAGVDTVVISGAETEVCVMAAVIGAIDLGYRVIIATDAICSSADSTHDAMHHIYDSRFGMQVETAEVVEIVEARGQ
ncbi:isochorismatase family cysteine hydrolase [Devosia sp. Root413D1]|uniref:isochorismatase family cysteine hydrolase n=1 Tax=Devosia sp. Root413D1 TaxID=1736531 RepID=UPI000A663196|nr:isochorismatase family cysteine hydrolase [Devosia sp. Root413D1]